MQHAARCRRLPTGGTGNGKKTRLPKGDIETLSSYKKARDLENDGACADARGGTWLGTEVFGQRGMRTLSQVNACQAAPSYITMVELREARSSHPTIRK